MNRIFGRDSQRVRRTRAGCADRSQEGRLAVSVIRTVIAAPGDTAVARRRTAHAADRNGVSAP